MTITEFIKAVGFENFSIPCEFCPLRDQCRADEEKRTKQGLDSETCTEFLKRVLTD